MVANPLGLVQTNDYGLPRVLSGKARETISGGWFVGVSGAINMVTSGTASYVTEDIEFIHAGASSNFVGVALANVTSGQLLSVAIDGEFIVRAGGSVFAGNLLKISSGTNNDAVENLGSQAIPASTEDAAIAGNVIGRALTAASSGNFCVAVLHL